MGDRERDLEPGRSLGCKAVLVNTGPLEKDVAADFTAPSLLEAVHWIIGNGVSPERYRR